MPGAWQLLATTLCCCLCSICSGQSSSRQQQPSESPACAASKLADSWPPRAVLRHYGKSNSYMPKKKDQITIGAMIKVHEPSSVGQCGPVSPMGVLEVEMMLYTVNKVNEDGWLPFTIGLLVKDDCGNASYALEESLEFVKGYITSILKDDSRRTACLGEDDGDFHSEKPPYIAAVLGATGSASSIQMANLLKLFKVPQIGYWATNSELTNKRYYKYYLRTIPNEEDFLEIIGKVVVSMNWTYVSIVYEDSSLSKQSQSTMEAMLRKLEVCVALSLPVKPSEMNVTTLENVVTRLGNTPARGVILITSETTALVTNLMQAIRNLNATGKFVWLGNRDWSRSPEISSLYEKELEGAITVEPLMRPVSLFLDYLKQIDPLKYDLNPWFREWWESKFRCKFNQGESYWSPHTCAYEGNPCSALDSSEANMEKLISSHVGLLNRLQLINDAVLSVVFGLQNMHLDKCAHITTTSVCSYMNTTTMNTARNEHLHELLQASRFLDLALNEFNFSDDGDGPRKFEIFNFQAHPSGRNIWRAVGNYTGDIMKLDISAMRFMANSPTIPVSVCSKPCLSNQSKMVLDNQPCCWSCIDCGEYEYVEGGACRLCSLGSKPSADKTGCVNIPPAYLTHTHPVSIVAITVAMAGIATTVAIGALFIAKRDTPVVRAAGREMTFALLGGILLCYLTAFVITAQPSDTTCVLQNTVPGVSFTICYAAILLKANRIYRIFNSGRRSTRRPKCVSPLSTIFLCAGIVFVQILITTLWIIVRMPRAGLWHPTQQASFLVCLTPYNEPERSHMVAFAFPIALLIVCIVHAVLTRKIPGAFNESKLIGFTVYTTCIIWLAFVPLYTTVVEDVPIMLATECFAIMLSATVSLACVFFPKTYIIVFRAEKNTRHRGGTSFRSRGASFRTVNNSFITAETPAIFNKDVADPESITSSGYQTLGKEASVDKSSGDPADSPKCTASTVDKEPRKECAEVTWSTPSNGGTVSRSASKRARINLPTEEDCPRARNSIKRGHMQ